MLDLPSGHQLALGIEVICNSFPTYASFETGARIDYATGLSRGDLESYAIFPDGGTPGSSFTFTNQPSGKWFDPPGTTAYQYTMAPGGTLFTRISGFPANFDPTMHVWAEGVDLGAFGTGQTLDFTTLLGHGVSSFLIDQISPTADPSDPQGFPLQLEFSQPTASFTMTAVPEPAYALAAATFAILGLLRPPGRRS